MGSVGGRRSSAIRDASPVIIVSEARSEILEDGSFDILTGCHDVGNFIELRKSVSFCAFMLMSSYHDPKSLQNYSMSAVARWGAVCFAAQFAISLQDLGQRVKRSMPRQLPKCAAETG